MSDDLEETPTSPPRVPAVDRPRGPLGWFSAALGEALTAAFAIAIAFVAGLFRALLAPAVAQKEEEDEA